MASRLFGWVGRTLSRSPDPSDPLSAILRAEPFDHVHLLSSPPGSVSAPHRARLQRLCDELEIVDVALDDPADHDAIYRTARRCVDARRRPADALTFLLSSQSPAIHSVWLLLAKTSHPARLLQHTPGRGVQEVQLSLEVPDPPQAMAAPDRLVPGSIPVGASLPRLLEELELWYIERALEQTGGNKAEASRSLGYNSPQAMAYRLAKLRG